MTSTAPDNAIRRVGIIFSGGPAPAANAVIAAATKSFLEEGREVIGFYHGYSFLQEYDPAQPLIEGQHYCKLTERDLRGLRNERGVLLRTARANPGKPISCRADLADPEKTDRLRRVYQALASLEIDALVSIGGDDTLKTANYIHLFQDHLPVGSRRIRVVHLPKTIDNDYRGIDFTFGFFTAVDVMAKELMNLRADAMTSNGYFLIETMGRKAGWLAYGVAIAGEANLAFSVEDIAGPLTVEENGRTCVDLDALANRIVDVMLKREELNEFYGTVVLAEGIGEMLPDSFIATLPRDEHGHIALNKLDVSAIMVDYVVRAYAARTGGKKKKVTSIQLGYESRCAPPHAFDVMLGSQLGIGAFRALVEEGLDGCLVSCGGQLDLNYVPFSELVDPQTLVTEVRMIEPGSDFHHLARVLETRLS